MTKCQCFSVEVTEAGMEGIAPWKFFVMYSVLFFFLALVGSVFLLETAALAITATAVFGGTVFSQGVISWGLGVGAFLCAFVALTDEKKRIKDVHWAIFLVLIATTQIILLFTSAHPHSFFFLGLMMNVGLSVVEFCNTLHAVRAYMVILKVLQIEMGKNTTLPASAS